MYKIKILLASSCWGTYGGIEAFVLAVAQYLHRQKDYSVRVAWKKNGNFHLTEHLQRRCEDSGVPFVFIDARSTALWKEIRWADLIHAQNSPPDVVGFSKLLGKPLALTIHNRRMKEHVWKSLGWGICQRMADRRWYNSQFVRKSWEGEKNRKGSSVIPTVSELPEGEIPIRLRKGFCFASRWIANKGMDLLLEAYATGGFCPAEWPLDMIGEGPMYCSLRNRYESTLGIRFHGFVSEAEKRDLIRHCKWMIIPPHTSEDLGLTAIEARNVGVPCIATQDGGLPEAAGPSALLCEPRSVSSLREAMRQAVSISDEDYERRSTLAKSSLETFLMPMSGYGKLYQEIIRR